MRGRLPYAAKTLIEQVVEAKPRTSWLPVDQPDGLGVHRTVEFSKATSDWLEPLLREIDDPRVVAAFRSSNGGLRVQFTHKPAADSRRPFPLDAAIEVLK